MMLVILVLGFILGAILQYAKLNRYDVISGLAILEDFSVAKAIAVAVGFGALLINIEISLGLAAYHVKPFLVGGVILGGLIFGAGMALLGYCPGTLAVSMGEGSLDAWVGMIGGLFGGCFFTVTLPGIKWILGPNLGKIALHTIATSSVVFILLMVVFAAIMVGLSFWLHKKEQKSDLKWLYAGVGLAILNALVFLSFVANRPIGASTTYPYLADVVLGLKNNAYFEKIRQPGQWELIFLGGAFLAGLIISLIKKEFKLVLQHALWKRFKGDAQQMRIIWSFLGGFILIYGARMAGGCTSGHILSGGMQIAVSSLVFGAFALLGLLLTGRWFYAKKEHSV
ncbi:YeeE/YedE thiosulfate transporter family protein [Caldithrix abyssi]